MLRALALALSVATGFTALVYEVTWQRWLATLLGSHSEATAAVLGIFLGGLAAGYALFGGVSRRIAKRGGAPQLLAAYGAVEAAIGVYALLFPALFVGVRDLSVALPLTGAASFAADVALSALLIGPPAVMMGSTIPMLTQALGRTLADATRFHALLYACNTAGAFCGALAAGFWLVPSLGLVDALVAMSVINLGAGGAYALLGRRAQTARTAPPRSAEPKVAGLASLAWVALLVGFGMMALQTVLIRLGALFFGSSQFIFATVVAVFVLCIAVGSFSVAALPRIPRFSVGASLWALCVCFALLYGLVNDGPYWAYQLRAQFGASAASFALYHFSILASALALLGVPIALSGAVLPLLFHELRREVGELGRTAGRLYSWNTVGSLLGALLGGYVLLAWLDLHEIYRVALGALAVAAAIVTARLQPRASAALAASALAGLALLPAWSADRLSSGAFRHLNLELAPEDGPEELHARLALPILRFYDDDPVASISVREGMHEGQLDRSIATNGKTDGSIGIDYPTMALAGLVPALFAERANRAFVIGYGTGITAGELAALSTMREVLVAEISPAVIEAAPLFDYGNLGASTQPRVRILRGDAYRSLLRSQGRFDVIVSEPSNPWVSGVELLYSREFLEAGRARLEPGGVYAQWINAYEIDTESLALVLRTFSAAFDHVAVWYGLGLDLLLLGFDSPEHALDLERLAARAARPDFAAGLARSRIRGLAPLLAHELVPLGVARELAGAGPIHTLTHPRLGDRAARAFFAGSQGRLPATLAPEVARLARANSLAGRLLAGPIDDRVRMHFTHELCNQRPRECATLLAWWTLEQPRSWPRTRLMRALRRQKVLDPNPVESMQPLTHLFAGNPPPDAAAGDLASAIRVADLYRTHDAHAAPIPRRALEETWARCRADPERRETCVAARAEMEAGTAFPAGRR